MHKATVGEPQPRGDSSHTRNRKSTAAPANRCIALYTPRGCTCSYLGPTQAVPRRKLWRRLATEHLTAGKIPVQKQSQPSPNAWRGWSSGHRARVGPKSFESFLFARVVGRQSVKCKAADACRGLHPWLISALTLEEVSARRLATRAITSPVDSARRGAATALPRSDPEHGRRHASACSTRRLGTLPVEGHPLLTNREGLATPTLYEPRPKRRGLSTKRCSLHAPALSSRVAISVRTRVT